MDSQRILRFPLLFPALLGTIALVLLVMGKGALAFAFLMFGLGLLLWMMGKARRWKGAPEAGIIVAAIGGVVAIMSLIG